MREYVLAGCLHGNLAILNGRIDYASNHFVRLTQGCSVHPGNPGGVRVFPFCSSLIKGERFKGKKEE